MSQLRVFSTFTGIGGFELGIRNAYRNTHGGSEADEATPQADYRQRLLAQARQDTRTAQGQIGAGLNGLGADEGPLVVGYSEIDKFAAQVYQKHYPGVKNYGDITKINASDLPDFDCIVGGFPCQAFSIAGKRRGFQDTRGTLFFDLARIVKEKQPRLCVFENVKGLLSHDKGRTFSTIIATLDELGYDCQWQVLNSKNHGVPQNRERVIIVGHLRGTPRPEVFPLRGSNGDHIKEITRAVPQAQRVYDESGIAPSVDTGQGGNRQPKIITGQRAYIDGKRDVEYKVSNESPTILATHYKSGDNQPKVLIDEAAGIKVYSDGTREEYVTDYDGEGNPINGRWEKQEPLTVQIKEATKKGYAEAEPGDAINYNQPNSKTCRGRVSKISPTIDTRMTIATLTRWLRIRRLTPLECERLQGFPDNWTEFGRDVFPVAEGDTFSHLRHTSNDLIMSDTQRYKMCGNAVTTNVIQAVFEQIFKTEVES